MIKLPRLYVGGKFKQIINPLAVSLSLNTVPLSTATITLPSDENLPARSYVELFNPYGSVGMFRVRSPHDAYGNDTTTAELEHMVAEVGDYLVKAELSEMISASDAMKKVFKHYGGKKWKLGSVSALGSGKIALEAKYIRVLDAMLSILQQKPSCMMDFDFTTNPWTINIVKKGTKVTAEGRLARNMTSAAISYDDSELATRVWYQTFTSTSDKKGKWVSKDADTLNTYGVIEATVNTAANMTADQIAYIVNTYINEHKNPRVNIDIQAVDLSSITGESMDKFVCGALMRLALPDYGLTVEKNIYSVKWADVYNDSMNVQVSLGDEEDTVVTFLHNLDSKGRGGGGGGKKQDEEDQKWQKYIMEREDSATRFERVAKELNEKGEILNQAGLKLNSKRVLIFAKDGKLISQINAHSDKLSLVVKSTKSGDKVNAAQIIMGINEEKPGLKKSHIWIDADVVDMSGKVNVTDFNALKGRFEKLLSGSLAVTVLKAGSIQTGTLRVNNVLFTKMTKYIDGQFINYLGSTS